MREEERCVRESERERERSLCHATMQTVKRDVRQVSALAASQRQLQSGSMDMELGRWELSRAAGVVEEVDTTCVTI